MHYENKENAANVLSFTCVTDKDALRRGLEYLQFCYHGHQLLTKNALISIQQPRETEKNSVNISADLKAISNEVEETGPFSETAFF